MTRYAIIVTVLLLLAIAWIVYREAGLRSGISEPEHQAALSAIAARNSAEKEAMVQSHRAEIASLRADLEANLQRAQAELADLRQKQASERRSRLQAAASSDAALRTEIASVSSSRASDIHSDADTVWLPKNATLAWLDRDLTLHHDLLACDRSCDTRLAKQRQEIVPPLVLARQTAELHSVDLDGQLRIAIAERDFARRQAAAGEGETLKWSLISGGVGLVVGTVAGGLAVGYIRR